jgi:hypothetical protein
MLADAQTKTISISPEFEKSGRLQEEKQTPTIPQQRTLYKKHCKNFNFH